MALDIRLVCALRSGTSSVSANLTRQLSLQPETLGAAQEVTNGLKHFKKRPLKEGQCLCGLQRAANVGQAPKESLWLPTLHKAGEGRRCWSSERSKPAEPPE